MKTLKEHKLELGRLKKKRKNALKRKKHRFKVELQEVSQFIEK